MFRQRGKRSRARHTGAAAAAAAAPAAATERQRARPGRNTSNNNVHDDDDAKTKRAFVKPKQTPTTTRQLIAESNTLSRFLTVIHASLRQRLETRELSAAVGVFHVLVQSLELASRQERPYADAEKAAFHATAKQRDRESETGISSRSVRGARVTHSATVGHSRAEQQALEESSANYGPSLYFTSDWFGHAAYLIRELQTGRHDVEHDTPQSFENHEHNSSCSGDDGEDGRCRTDQDQQAIAKAVDMYMRASASAMSRTVGKRQHTSQQMPDDQVRAFIQGLLEHAIHHGCARESGGMQRLSSALALLEEKKSHTIFAEMGQDCRLFSILGAFGLALVHSSCMRRGRAQLRAGQQRKEFSETETSGTSVDLDNQLAIDSERLLMSDAIASLRRAVQHAPRCVASMALYIRALELDIILRTTSGRLVAISPFAFRDAVGSALVRHGIVEHLCREQVPVNLGKGQCVRPDQELVPRSPAMAHLRLRVLQTYGV